VCFVSLKFRAEHDCVTDLLISGSETDVQCLRSFNDTMIGDFFFPALAQ
jgi:hypothetical protein